MDNAILQQEIIKQLSNGFQLQDIGKEISIVSMPFHFPDGDYVTIYVENGEAGKIRISDKGDIMMRLSYQTPDVEIYYKSNRGKLMKAILKNNGVQENHGDFFIETNVEELVANLFCLSQTIIEIYNINYIDRYKETS